MRELQTSEDLETLLLNKKFHRCSCIFNFIFLAFWIAMIGVIVYYYSCKSEYLKFGEEYVMHILLSATIWDGISITFYFLLWHCKERLWKRSQYILKSNLVLHILFDISAVAVNIYGKAHWEEYQEEIDNHYVDGIDFDVKALLNLCLALLCVQAVLFISLSYTLTMVYEKSHVLQEDKYIKLGGIN